MVSPPAGHQWIVCYSLIVNPSILVSCCFLWGGHSSGPLCYLPVSLCDLFLKPEEPQNKSRLPFFRVPTCSHFKLSQRAAAYSNIQRNYETKGPGPLSVAPVSRITSQTHSPATKASIVRQPSPRISSGGDCTLNWAWQRRLCPRPQPRFTPSAPIVGNWQKQIKA